MRAGWGSRLPLLVVTRWLAPGGSAGAQGTCSVPVVVAVTPDLPVPQTALVVQAVKKDQEGDAVAALSLYCKALDFFVPALRCECRGARAAGALSPRCTGWAPEAAPLPEFCGRRGRGYIWDLVLWGILEGLVWVRPLPQTPPVNSRFLQTKWMPSERRQLRQRWVSESRGGNGQRARGCRDWLSQD